MEAISSFICVQVIEDLLESSSSSDDDEIFAGRVARVKVPRVQNFIENVIHQYSKADFKKNLRLSRESVMYLMERYSLSYVARSYQGGRKQSTIETQVLSFLWFCGNKTTFREVANIFDMSLSNTHTSFRRVLTFLLSEVAPEDIKFPESNTEKEAVAKDFEKISGFPNVLGCIDGSYIANRHDTVSITLQGICDSNLRFLDVFTGVPSKIHDSRVLKMSFIGKDLPTICLPKYHLLGDSAYPLREFLLTPFRDYGNLSESEKNYNLKFCRTRVKIENAFGALKGRFRQLMRLDFTDVEIMARFIVATCCLHNICIDRNDLSDEEVDSTESFASSESLDVNRRENLLSQLGQIKRNEIKSMLFNSST